MAAGEVNMSPLQKELLLRQIHSGEVNVFALPVQLYRQIANEFNEAILAGYGLKLGDLDISTPDFETIRSLQRNTYVFSAAKTFQQINDVQNLIFDRKGFTRPFRLFEKDAAKIFDVYNKVWLKAEFETAKEGARAAKRWNEIQQKKDVFPLLMYRTRQDSRVRPEHAELDGIIRPVDDPFWDTHTPPNGWGCNNRCRLVKLQDAPQITPLKKVKLDPKKTPGDLAPETWIRGDRKGKNGKALQMDPNPKLFNLNFGKESIIFPESSKGLGITSHPYFRVHKRFKTHKDNNFGLPIPEILTRPAVKVAPPIAPKGPPKPKQGNNITFERIDNNFF